MNQQHKPLTVYRASAGSGKTFTLAVEYIKLLVTNPENYRYILAVTFTNKATEEMKMRILSQLYGLSRQTTLKESLDYLDQIKQKTGLGEVQIKKNAALALHYLLNDYSSFHIETIDSFFQRVLRNMARELELTPNLRLELNDKEVESMAVDHLVDSLCRDHAIFQSIMRLIYEKMRDNKSWNVIQLLKKFGMQIFNDTYKEEIRPFAEKVYGNAGPTLSEQEKEKRWNAYFDEIEKQMKASIARAEAEIRKLGESYFRLLGEHQLAPDDIAGNRSRGINLYFYKMCKGLYTDDIKGNNFEKYYDDTDAWTKKANRDAVTPIVRDILIPYLVRTERRRQQVSYHALSASCTLKHLHQLKLLVFLEREVRRLNSDANRFLLSDTQHLLQSFISDSDAPFIYEKIGGRLKHIMIDEFQDTSVIQWRNFKVLMNDCMSRNDKSDPSNCLIVGDVKQSIYRWRNGDWKLLNAIDDQFTAPETMIRHEPLDTNYRSSKHIVRFNNAFFKAAIEETQKGLLEQLGQPSAQLSNAYFDVEQKIKNDDGRGYVRIALLPDDWEKEAVLAEVGKQVQRILGKGYQQSDIAILIRRNIDVPDIAEWFMAHLPKVHIISDMAFELQSSSAVNTIIAALRYLNDRTDNISQSILTKAWNQLGGGEVLTDSDLFCGEAPKAALLPPGFLESADRLCCMPLLQAIENICDLFHLSSITGEAPYISTFFDMVNKFVRDNTSDISTLLRFWDDELHTKCIHTDLADGVRLTSIHKSKGLEYKNVIIPFCDWALEHRDEMIWCKPDIEPYHSLLPIVPVDYSSKLLGTIYADAYKEEYLQVIVDNLNLLYVAFTRAENNLFVFGQSKGNNKSGGARRTDVIAAILPKIADCLEATVSDKEEHEEQAETTLFEYGELDDKPTPSKKDETTRNVFLQRSTALPVRFSTHQQKATFRQSNESMRFVEIEDEDQQRIGRYILRGNILHTVMSRITTLADVDHVLRELESDGIIYTDDINRQDLMTLISRNLSHPLAKEWFSDRWTVYSECNILEGKEGVVSQRRPDRVMTDGKSTIVVDYKSGRENEHTLPDYQNQVRTYIDLLERMGFPDVKGYLWYLGEQKITPVNRTNA